MTTRTKSAVGTLGFLLFLALAGLGFGGCGGPDPAETAEEYRMLKEGTSLAEHEAMCRYLEKYGWDVEKMAEARYLDRHARHYLPAAMGVARWEQTQKEAREAGFNVPSYTVKDFCRDVRAELWPDEDRGR